MTSNLITVLVMFNCNNRKLTLPEDIKLEGLIEEFMRAFKDVIPPDVPPTQFLFQKFDPHYEEWVDMTEDEPIRDGEKIQVLEKLGVLLPGLHIHRITDSTYRIWSLVSRSNASLMKRDGTTMKCDGKSSENANLLDIKTAAADSGRYNALYRLEMKVPDDPSKIYLVTGKGENQEVEVQKVDVSSLPDTANTKFEPQYFYSFTLFRCQQVGSDTDLYLESDHDGKLILAKRGPAKYPNPATLFICYQ